MDTPSIFEQPDAKAVSPLPTRTRTASPRKAAAAPTSSGLHPIQEKAIRFIALTQDHIPQDQTMAQYSTQFTTQFLTEAVAYHLSRVQRHGEEFPPKLLAKLTELQLLK